MLLLQLLPDLDWIILYALYVDALAGREREGNETSSLAGFLIPGFNLLIILGRASGLGRDNPPERLGPEKSRDVPLPGLVVVIEVGMVSDMVEVLVVVYLLLYI